MWDANVASIHNGEKIIYRCLDFRKYWSAIWCCSSSFLGSLGSDLGQASLAPGQDRLSDLFRLQTLLIPRPDYVT